MVMGSQTKYWIGESLFISRISRHKLQIWSGLVNIMKATDTVLFLMLLGNYCSVVYYWAANKTARIKTVYICYGYRLEPPLVCGTCKLYRKALQNNIKVSQVLTSYDIYNTVICKHASLCCLRKESIGLGLCL